MKKYIALDTETDKGKAFILSHAGGVEEINNRIAFGEIVRKLGKHFVFYNLDYDVSAILRHFPEKCWKKIYIEKRVALQGFWLRYFPHKLLKMSYKKHTAEFFDLFSFFQCSLAKAAKLCGIEEKKIVLPQGWIKNLKSHWQNEKTRGKVSAYARQDAVLLQKISDILFAALDKIGLGDVAPYSPGYVAKRFLIKRGISFGKLPRRYETFARRAYHGARIEVFRRGFFKSAYGADIKSAYPAAFANLPDICNASYYYSKVPETKYYLAEARVVCREHDFYLLPFFKNGINYFPRFDGEITWLTNFETECFKKHRLGEVQFRKVLNIGCLDTRPYKDLVEELFARRKNSGVEGLIFKLILNSLYGISAEQHDEYREVEPHVASIYMQNDFKRESKIAFHILQSRICKHARRYWERKCRCNICEDTRRFMRWKIPQWLDIDELEGAFYRKSVSNGRLSNVVVAALVTAQVRVKVFEKLLQCKKPIAVFTDSIFSETLIPGVKKKAGLGEWESTGKCPLLMIGSGVYQFGETVKMRGFRYDKSLRELLRRSRTNVISIPQNKRASMGIQLRQHVEGREMNEIFESEKKLDINFDHKRNWNFDYKSGREMLEKICTSTPKNVFDI